MPPRFLDTNVLLRYFTRDDEEKAEAALALLERAEQGQERLETSLLVIFETVFTLQRFYRVPREQISHLLHNVLRIRGIHLPEKALCQHALDLYATTGELSLADAYDALYMQDHGALEIYSWDRDFDHIPGIKRLEPQRD